MPIGPLEPYAAFGMGHGWILKKGHEDIVSMSRLSVAFRLSEHLALGVEGTLQKIDSSDFRLVSLGSVVSIDF